VRRKLFTPDEAREGPGLLRALAVPTPAAHLRLHDLALDIGIAVDHPTSDTLYLAFAVAMGATVVVWADAAFVRSVRAHPQPTLAGIALPLEEWGRSRSIAPDDSL